MEFMDIHSRYDQSLVIIIVTEITFISSLGRLLIVLLGYITIIIFVLGRFVDGAPFGSCSPSMISSVTVSYPRCDLVEDVSLSLSCMLLRPMAGQMPPRSGSN